VGNIHMSLLNLH